jgi:hypothetical protein
MSVWHNSFRNTLFFRGFSPYCDIPAMYSINTRASCECVLKKQGEGLWNRPHIHEKLGEEVGEGGGG